MPLFVIGIGGTFVNICGGDDGFHLVEFPFGKGIDLIDIDECSFGYAESIVLIEVVEVRHLRAIVPQFRRQESFEPGCFVDALFADEYEDVLVDDVILHPRSDHSDEPFGEDLYP